MNLATRRCFSFIRKYVKAIFFAALFFFTLLPAVVVFLLGYRFLKVNTKRIGHLVGDLTSYFKNNHGGNFKYLVLAPSSTLANKAILKYLPGKVNFITSDFFCMLMRPLLVNPIATIILSKYSESHTECHIVLANKNNGSNNGSKVVRLTEGDSIRAVDGLSRLGITFDDWFICVHSRESGYSRGNDFGQSFRNSDIKDYELAIQKVLNKGGACIRIGDPSMRPISILGKFIDYAHSEKRDDFLDLAICSSAKLFLGNTSGVFSLSNLFGVPVCLANMIPLSHLFPPIGIGNVAIPKLLIDHNGEYLSFRKTFELGFSNIRTDHEWNRSHCQIVNNSPEDIADLLVEKLGVLDGSFVYTEDDFYMQKYVKLLFTRLSPYDFNPQSLVGTAFLRKYKDILL
jgi:putative glycosyltransferase (TIGR04372 family)